MRLVIIGILLVTALLGSVVMSYTTQKTLVIDVTGKERVVQKSGDTIKSRYLVYTTTETFENTDCFCLFKFNSSDIQGKLDKGRYRVLVYGYRIPFLSWYRNICS